MSKTPIGGTAQQVANFIARLKELEEIRRYREPTRVAPSPYWVHVPEVRKGRK